MIHREILVHPRFYCHSFLETHLQESKNTHKDLSGTTGQASRCSHPGLSYEVSKWVEGALILLSKLAFCSMNLQVSSCTSNKHQNQTTIRYWLWMFVAVCTVLFASEADILNSPAASHMLIFFFLCRSWKMTWRRCCHTNSIWIPSPWNIEQ